MFPLTSLANMVGCCMMLHCAAVIVKFSYMRLTDELCGVGQKQYVQQGEEGPGKTSDVSWEEGGPALLFPFMSSSHSCLLPLLILYHCWREIGDQRVNGLRISNCQWIWGKRKREIVLVSYKRSERDAKQSKKVKD